MKTFPPRKCKATANRSGQQCRRDAIVGSDICYTHGGRAPQVRAKAEQRVTLAEALASAPKRHPWEVLEDGLHAMDLVMQETLAEIQDAGNVTPQLLDKLVQSVTRAHQLAKTNLDAGIDQRKLRLAEAQAGQMQAIFTRVLAALHLTPEQKALVPQVLRREIEGEIAA